MSEPRRTSVPLPRRGAVAVAVLGAALGSGGCIHDADCGICDPQNLVLESISGVNYASDKIHLLSPACDGPACPGRRDHGHYFVSEIGRCEDSEDAKASPRGATEYCKLSPLVSAYGLEFIFNNLLEPTSVELVRKRPDQPRLFEVYDWKTKVLALHGPTTRYNGDVSTGGADDPDVVARGTNLACIDNLRELGQGYDHTVAADPATDPCQRTRVLDGAVVPMKMRVGTPDAEIHSYRGLVTHGSADQFDCLTPESGADTCCSECDWLLSTRIARYGVAAAGEPRTPNYEPGAAPGNGAIECDPAGDAYRECAAFEPAVDRGPEQQPYEYHWSCAPDDPGCARERFALPRYDKLRETHPDARPSWAENLTARCSGDAECLSVHDLPGTECIGVGEDGRACDPDIDPACSEGRCRAAWFVGCEADPATTGGSRGFCVDRRFSAATAAACYTARTGFQGRCEPDGGGCDDIRAGARLAQCDSVEGDGTLAASDCCQDALGAALPACDPYFQPAVAPRPIYDRSEHLPHEARACICEDSPAAQCADVVAALCTGDDGELLPERRGQYAVAFIDRTGGVIYDPAIKGFEWRPADIGNLPRARVEQCAEDRGVIASRNRHDGWRANDGAFIEAHEDFDRALCSGQRYTVVFATEGEHVVDKVGNDLSGRTTYQFETSQFHVVPDSGFPADNLRIGACDEFSLRFSNKVDLSPANLRKLAIYELPADAQDPGASPLPRGDCGVVPVAGGANCYDDPDALDADPCGAPCLTVDVTRHAVGEIAVAIDPVRFDAVLRPEHRYRLSAPGLDDIAQMADPAAYAAAFWDACGMPLVLGGTADDRHDDRYDFTIDQPKCKEDPDNDRIPTSCDNADDVPNGDQADADADGIGDVIDLCPVVPSLGNMGDSDDDGVGNACDVCRRPTQQYNLDDAIAFRMRVDNNPSQQDRDGDGIGDACDNCVTVANCGDYDASAPWQPGAPQPPAGSVLCQRDDDVDMIGDACEDAFADGAAGPVGLGDDDDFDQDGLSNAVDACPRIAAPAGPCESDADCPAGSRCEPCPATGHCAMAGTCNHTDSEPGPDGTPQGDGVGDICDTCPAAANPLQHFDGGAQDDDDPDGDFIGTVCETNAECSGTGGTEGRPLGFYEIAAAGYCCTVVLEQNDDGNLIVRATGEVLLDPGVRDAEGRLLRAPVPVRLDCDEPADLDPLSQTCRRLPDRVAQMPGVLVPPAGCDAALAGLDPRDNPAIAIEPGGDIAALWSHVCLLPPLDQDFDGYGDRCDLCPFDYDDENLPFSDERGRLWPKAGAVCNGGYALDLRCEVDGSDTDGSGSDSSGGSSDEGGSSGSSG